MDRRNKKTKNDLRKRWGQNKFALLEAESFYASILTVKKEFVNSFSSKNAKLIKMLQFNCVIFSFRGRICHSF